MTDHFKQIIQDSFCVQNITSMQDLENVLQWEDIMEQNRHHAYNRNSSDNNSQPTSHQRPTNNYNNPNRNTFTHRGNNNQASHTFTPSAYKSSYPNQQLNERYQEYRGNPYHKPRNYYNQNSSNQNDNQQNKQPKKLPHARTQINLFDNRRRKSDSDINPK